HHLIVVYHFTILDIHSFPTRRSSDLVARRRTRFRAQLQDRGSRRPEAAGYRTRRRHVAAASRSRRPRVRLVDVTPCVAAHRGVRSEEHTSELQSLAYLVCRLLLEKKK